MLIFLLDKFNLQIIVLTYKGFIIKNPFSWYKISAIPAQSILLTRKSASYQKGGGRQISLKIIGRLFESHALTAVVVIHPGPVLNKSLNLGTSL